MVKVIFKNLKKSEFIKAAIEEKFQHLQEKFSEELTAAPTVIVAMENSPRQAGADSFTVKVLGITKKLGLVVFHKSSLDFYEALQRSVEGFSIVLNKRMKRRRAKAKKERRRFVALAS